MVIDFYLNKCIFAFDLSADHSGTDPEGHWSETRKGTIRIEVRFNAENDFDLTLIAFAEYNTLYEIDNLKNLSKVT